MFQKLISDLLFFKVIYLPTLIQEALQRQDAQIEALCPQGMIDNKKTIFFLLPFFKKLLDIQLIYYSKIQLYDEFSV